MGNNRQQTIMKRTLVLVFSLFLGLAAAQAQQQFATLQHGDSISVFYGMDAFKNAHNASVNGDIVTLSSGVFNRCTISKAITIRGAGMFQDTLLHTISPSIIVESFTINIPQDSVYFLTMEGLCCPSRIHVQNAYNPHFVKCYLPDINATETQRTMYNAQFLNSIIGFYGSRLPITATNCVIIDDGVLGFSLSAYNCILPKLDAWQASCTMSLHNCIYIPYRSSYLWTFDCLQMTNNQDSTYASVFKEYRGTFDYNNPVSFELQDSVAATVLGSDGTQVGIYGGQFPFNPRVVNYKATVANQSRPDGKLEVTVQPVNE